MTVDTISPLVPRIPRGNEFTLRLALNRLDDEQNATPLTPDEYADCRLFLRSAINKCRVDFRLDGDEMVATVPATLLPTGLYGIEVYNNRLRFATRDVLYITEYSEDAGPCLPTGRLAAPPANAVKVTCVSITGSLLPVGPRGTSITSIEQIETSTENGGVNIVRVTLDDDTYYDFEVRNGDAREAIQQALDAAGGAQVATTEVRQLSEDIQAAEDTRNSNEAGRGEAEQLRADAETQRATNETVRIEAENARLTSENSRVEAENLRSVAEQARTSAEQVRTNSENSRTTAEDTRIQAEDARTTAENLRSLAEQARVSAEAQRAADFVTAQAQRTTDFNTSQQARQEAFTQQLGAYRTDVDGVIATVQDKVDTIDAYHTAVDTLQASLTHSIAGTLDGATGDLQFTWSDNNLSITENLTEGEIQLTY